jgi:hypothetical protein
MESSLVKLSPQNFSAHLQIGLRFESILSPLLLLLETYDAGRDRETVLKIEVKEHDLSTLGCGFHQARIIEGEGELSLRCAAHRARKKQLARVGREL